MRRLTHIPTHNIKASHQHIKAVVPSVQHALCEVCEKATYNPSSASTHHLYIYRVDSSCRQQTVTNRDNSGVSGFYTYTQTPTYLAFSSITARQPLRLTFTRGTMYEGKFFRGRDISQTGLRRTGSGLVTSTRGSLRYPITTRGYSSGEAPLQH